MALKMSSQCDFKNPWMLQQYKTNYTSVSLILEDHLNLPNPADLLIYPIQIAAVLFVLKFFILMPYVYKPLAASFKIKSRRHYPRGSTSTGDSKENLVLESRRNPVQKLAQKILNVCRQKTQPEASIKVNKFLDCSWQLTYYLTSTAMGVYTVYDRPWLFDFDKCWTNFPFQSIDSRVWWYYMAVFGFYLEETAIHFTRPKTKDSTVVLVHHVCAMLLLTGTWLTNILRIGPINVLIFECNDIPLLIGKLLKYIGKKQILDWFFVIFLIMWIVTRLGIFPFGVMAQCFKEAGRQSQTYFHFYYVLNFLLVVAMVMNLGWTYSIVRVIAKKVKSGEMEDVRSSGEESNNDDDDQEKSKSD